MNIRDFTINKKLMADNKLSASFTSPVKVDYPLNESISVNGENYYLTRPPAVTKGGKDMWKYQLDLEADIYILLRKQLRYNGNKKFTIFGNLEFFVDILLDNINETYPTWTKGFIEPTQNKTVTFQSTDCRAAVNQLAKEFEVEFEVKNKVVTFKKKIGNDTGLTFEYGRGKGLYVLNRKNVDSKDTVTRVYGYGSSRNLPKDYRSGADELVFEERYLENFSELSDIIEANYSNNEIYPRFLGTITVVSPDYLTITVPSMDFNLNDQLNEGQEAKIVFQSGDLKGREFVIQEGTYNDTTKTFSIIADVDETGTEYPNSTFRVNVGDEITFVDIHMPQSYIDNAEEELRVATAAFLVENSKLRVTYDLTFDHNYLQKFGVLPQPGDLVTIKDTDLNINRLIRIASISYKQSGDILLSYRANISDYIPITASQRLVSQVLNSRDTIEINDTQNIELARKNTLLNRGLRDRVFDQEGYFDPNNIKPKSIESLYLSIGAKASDFLLQGVTFNANTNGDPNHFTGSAGVLNHLEIERDGGGQDWNMSAFDSPGLISTKEYYFYAKCSKISNAGEWIIDEAQLAVEDATHYYFLVGTLYTVRDNFRPSKLIYGVTFISGNEITTGVITSIDGQNYVNLNNGTFKLGGLDHGVTAPNQTTLKGVFVQSPAGVDSLLPVYRGAYTGGVLYYKGDEVTNGGSTWRYINDVPSQDNVPTEGTYWTIKADKGDQGDQGVQGEPGQDGATGPSAVLKGAWGAAVLYNNNAILRDYVKVGSVYYGYIGVDNSTAPTPPNAAYWEPISSFVNVATDLLLAQEVVTDLLTVAQLRTAVTGKRITISRDDNNFIFRDASGNVILKMDDDIFPGTPGLEIPYGVVRVGDNAYSPLGFSTQAGYVRANEFYARSGAVWAQGKTENVYIRTDDSDLRHYLKFIDGLFIEEYTSQT